MTPHSLINILLINPNLSTRMQSLLQLLNTLTTQLKEHRHRMMM